MKRPMIEITDEIQKLINGKALFVINHSGGKDSQTMTLLLSKIIPDNQLMIVHAHLPGVEWPGNIEHIQKTAPDIQLKVVQAVKTFFQMVQHRQKWPSPKNRQCTSDLKRGPIEKAIRHELKARSELIVVNCMGMRAQESSGRAKLKTFKRNGRNSKAGREWYDWLPIHHLLEKEIFQIIAENNQKPHWAYSQGMSRLSCCFCIMANKNDLKTAARLNPALFQKYVETEKELNQTIMMPSAKKGRQFLEEIIKD